MTLHRLGVAILVAILIVVMLAATGGPYGLGAFLGDFVKGVVATVEGFADGVSS